MAGNRPFEGLGDLLVEYQFRKNQLEEQKKQHAETVKIQKAQLLLDEEKARREALSKITELTTRQIRAFMKGATPQEREEMPIDMSKFYISQETKQPVYTAERSAWGDWYKTLTARRLGEEELGREKEIKAIEHGYKIEEEKAKNPNTYYGIWVKQQPPGADISMEAYRKAFGGGKETKVDYGKALDYAKYEYALRGVGGTDLNRVDLHNMAKEIEDGSMQTTQEADVLLQLVKAKTKNKKITIDWAGMSAKYPDLDIQAIQQGLKTLGY